MRVTDMVACGGEANAYPKHFAYFLPEDEGVKGEPGQRKKTIVFRNAYRDRFTVISQPLGEAMFAGPRATPTRRRARAAGLVSRPRHRPYGDAASTDYGWRLDLGHEPFMMVQEAVSDVYGLLLTLTPTWLSLTGLSAVDASEVFLAELLHYLRRGPWLYGDAGAAYVELSYLLANDYMQMGTDGRVHWEMERLHEGMRALASEMATAVLEPPTAEPCKRFVATYGWPAQQPAARRCSASCRARCAGCLQRSLTARRRPRSRPPPSRPAARRLMGNPRVLPGHGTRCAPTGQRARPARRSEEPH